MEEALFQPSGDIFSSNFSKLLLKIVTFSGLRFWVASLPIVQTNNWNNKGKRVRAIIFIDLIFLQVAWFYFDRSILCFCIIYYCCPVKNINYEQIHHFTSFRSEWQSIIWLGRSLLRLVGSFAANQPQQTPETWNNLSFRSALGREESQIFYRTTVIIYI